MLKSPQITHWRPRPAVSSVRRPRAQARAAGSVAGRWVLPIQAVPVPNGTSARMTERGSDGSLP